MKKFEQVSNQICGSYTFNAFFDSGNLGRVEQVKTAASEFIEKQNVIRAELAAQHEKQNASTSSSSSAEASTSSASKERHIDAEFNLWTRPDCHGTIFENANRTWFFFSIRGGEKNQIVKLNLMNLNKQAKLFSQGMHPVIRSGSNGKWERMKEKPMFYVTEENFILSFFHKTYENIEDNLTFYAFTFPFTYGEQIELLQTYDRKHEKSEEELEIVIREMKGPRRDKLIINMNQDFVEDENNVVEDFKESLDVTEDANAFEVPTRDQTVLSASKEIDDNTSESMQQLSNLVKSSNLDEKTKPHEKVFTYIAQDVRSRLDDIRDYGIYYYRELLINSYEERRIDLVTITSFHGIEDKREERLKNLFPDHSKPRCHTFKDKKIIFISSRVHPGETPASFVLNGFVNLLLDRKNQVAAVLRKMYVFKIVPFLNPDGVYNGLYRSDTLGVNLNRVYLNPRLDTQPSIYAVRKLIRFYHFGFDKPDQVDEIGNPISDDIGENSMLSNDEQLRNDLDCGIENISAMINDPEPPPRQTEPEVVDEEPKVLKEHQNEEDIEMVDRTSNDELIDQTTYTSVDQEINGKSSQSRSLSAQPNKTGDNVENCDKKPGSKLKVSTNKLKETATNLKNTAAKEKKSLAKGDLKAKSAQVSNRHQHHHYKHFISHYNSEKQQKAMHQQYFSQQPHQGLNISMDFRVQTDENGDKSIVEESSNLFLYLDLHGHASKKGVFMYGNHLNNTQEAVEVMLLPRLMSMNCHHFAFDACNFSERNMYLKGKRDGLSKEGSGRVAVYKSTGLIKSYTLESNYNMAKCVNILPPKGKEVSCKIHNLIPPKFTPAIFEEVGRALGPSLLDLTNSNPTSRIINSEFRSLQGLRNSLKNEISRGLSKARVSKFTKATKKRQTTLTLPVTVSSAQDILKENKISSLSNSSSSSQQQLTKTQSLSQGPKLISTKIKPIGKIQAFGKKDVNLLTSAKKKKILCEASTSMSAVSTGLNQIPRKKIKVSNLSINLKGETASNSSVQTSSDSQLAKYFLTSTKALDDEMIPCCSKFLSKAPSSPSGSSSGSTNSGSQAKITSFLPIKKIAKNRKLKFGTAVRPRIGAKSLKKLRVEKIDEESQSNAQIRENCAGSSSAPSSKLLKKKKRLLKSLKKPLLH